MDDDHDLVADIDFDTLIWIVKFLKRGNVSVNSKPDHPPSDPRGFARFHCLGGHIFAQLPLPMGSGF